MTPLLEVFCLGDFKVRLDGVAIPALSNSKPLALWLYVALGGAERSRAHLAEVFWSELDDDAARGNLRLVLLRLRSLIPGHVVVTRTSVRVPQHARYVIDVTTVPAADDRSPASVDALLRRKPEEFLAAARLRHAPPFDDWVTAERQRLVAEHVSRLTVLGPWLSTSGDAARAIEVYRRCLSLVPWSEDHHRALIRCYADQGQRAAALAQFDACRHALRRELDVEPDAATRELIDSIRSAPAGGTPAAGSVSPVVARSEAPGFDPLAPLVDRTRERERLAQLLLGEGCRLVSLVGPGGVGKTHLAQHVAQSLGAAFRDGVRFVPLADVHPQLPEQGASLVEARIAETLGLPGGSASTRTALLAALAERELLLVLDNFEQLTDAAGLLEEITLRAPHVRVLVTSRHRLELPAEWSVRLEGLDYPVDPTWTDASSGYPAVELFIKVAERRAGLDVAANGMEILRICRTVEGYPLAITLAARWLATMTCREIAERLQDSLSLLSDTRHRAAPARHQSLAAVLDQSWVLLTRAEQAAFSGLSLFRGGFTLAAAAEVVTSDLDVLDRLIGKSLLRRRQDGRLEIHEVMRELGEAKLAQDADRAGAIRERHAIHYESLLREEHSRFERDPLGTAFERTRQDLANLLAAFDYRLGRGAAEPLAELLRGLWVFHKRFGWFADGAALLRRAIQLPSLPAEYACRWRLWLSDALFQLGRHDECRETVLASLAALGEPVPSPGAAGRQVARELLKLALPSRWISLGGARAPLRDDVARTHNRLAQVHFFEGDRLAFLAATLRSVNVAAVSDAVEHWASGALALAHTPLRSVAARYARRAERSIAHAEPFARAWAHEQLGLYALGIGEFASAERHTGQGAALFRELGQDKYWGECATLRVYAAIMRGDLAAARERVADNLERSRERRERFAEVWALCGIAHLELRAGRQPPADFDAAAGVVVDLVDPNTGLLYFGHAAWAAARRGDAPAALDALGTCHRVTRGATMLSIYALNGFIGQVMALIELAGRPANRDGQSELDGTAAAILRDFKRFAAPFPAAGPYAEYLKGRWMIGTGGTARGEALCARALRRRAFVLDPDTLISGGEPPESG
jgi:predicted ATPase/DNA-binding SARP family transcriptional activator